MADGDQSGIGGAGGAQQPPDKPKPAKADAPKEELRFDVKLRTNAIIDGKTHKAGATIDVTRGQLRALERDGTIPPDDD